MIVDDSNIMRRRIERSQQFEELEVVGTAGNGIEALEMFHKTDPDVVTMDLTMPQMDGIECISKLVQLKPAVRILVISALADKATAVEAMEKRRKRLPQQAVHGPAVERGDSGADVLKARRRAGRCCGKRS